MRMRKTVLLTAALLIVSAVLGGCGGCGTLKVGWRGSNARKRKWARYASFSGVERRFLRVEAGQAVELTYDVEVERGTLTLSLLGPDGETLWGKTFEGAEAGEVRIDVSQSGRHRLRVAGEKTRGGYDISWEVAGG